MTRHTVPGDGTLDINENLNGPMGRVLRRHALARGVRTDILIAVIVQRVLQDDLLRAILDDGK